MFDTREEAAMRLDGTVILGPRGPVYVREMRSEKLVRYRELDERGGLRDEEITGDLSKGFCIKPFPLGYVNWRDSCLYLQRMPVRKYKQGLHDLAISVVNNGGHGVRWRLNRLYEEPGFFSMCKGGYPSLEEVVMMMGSGNYLSRAFDREWALGFRDGKSHTLFYKGREVGLHFQDGGAFLLNDGRSYLQEALKEVIL